jgi:hypothetical protein
VTLSPDDIHAIAQLLASLSSKWPDAAEVAGLAVLRGIVEEYGAVETKEIEQ